MNFIQSLKAERAELDGKRELALDQINQFLALLHGPKFTGDDADERKDWIATADVIAWLREFRSTLL